MSSKNKKLTPAQLAYKYKAQAFEPKKPVLRNALTAFFVGGCVCLVGELLEKLYIRWLGFDEIAAGNPTVATLIFFAVVATGLGIYDKAARICGAGLGVPVSGFANGVASAAMEHRSEGIVLGTATEMFKVAGPVITYGVVAAFIMATIRVLIGLGG